MTDNEHLILKAAEMRLRIVQMMGPNKPHHFGGSLSCADLVAALYFSKLRMKPTDPKWHGRDRFIMSKGHSVATQYVALAMRGVLPIEELTTFKKVGSRLQGHPAMQYTPGVEACTGSLGQGLSFSVGVALAARLKGETFRIYCILGDGELHEGQIWEAAGDVPKLGLTNVILLVDHNGLKAMDDCADCCKPIGGILARFASLGWRGREIDGHSMDQICESLDWATEESSLPAVIVARTVKGKGVSCIENRPGFHNGALSIVQYEAAIAELTKSLAAVGGSI